MIIITWLGWSVALMFFFFSFVNIEHKLAANIPDRGNNDKYNDICNDRTKLNEKEERRNWKRIKRRLWCYWHDNCENGYWGNFKTTKHVCNSSIFQFKWKKLKSSSSLYKSENNCQFTNYKWVFITLTIFQTLKKTNTTLTDWIHS